MAPTLEDNPMSPVQDSPVAVVDAAEFKAAQQDQRVRSFLAEADAYLAELEQQGRNR